ncbi:MAG: hypothetical protein J0L92_39155, partial [Deltaproteobacteria bacterium]|nr:hypothetical protein [Deltaproteobacteria bacterium]
GCGSSREHAPWALLDFGFKAIIAESFADIFFNNCFKNGILPITVSPEDLDKLMDDASRGANAGCLGRAAAVSFLISSRRCSRFASLALAFLSATRASGLEGGIDPRSARSA